MSIKNHNEVVLYKYEFKLNFFSNFNPLQRIKAHKISWNHRIYEFVNYTILKKGIDPIVRFNFYREIHSGLGQRVQSGLHGAQLDQVFVRVNSNVFSFQIDQIHADFFRNSWPISNIGAGHLSEEFEMGLERFRFIRLHICSIFF